MDMTADSLSAATLEAAIDWQFRLRAEPGDAGLRQAHQDWLAADAAHLQAWLAVQRTWQVTGRMQAEATEGGTVAAFRPREKTRRPPRLVVAAAALAACLALSLLAPRLLLRLEADAVTAAAENSEIALADGSSVTLGGDSAFHAELGGAAVRRATLLRGEAHFRIAPDAARPFVIAAGPVHVTVVGTAFDVTLDMQTVSVAVASGVVEVGSAAGAGGMTRLRAGERVTVDRRTGQVAVAPVAPEDVGAWRQRRLVVHDLPLTEAIARLDRYHRGEIVVLAEGLEQRRVSGVFDLDDPARALRSMLAAGGPALRDVTLRQYTPYLVVINR
jgi:transmembrane sensor